MEEINENTTIKEFMEWFVSQHEGHYLPSDLDPNIHRLEGLAMGKVGTDEGNLLSSSLSNLRNFQTLLRTIKQFGNWKYRV